MKQADIPVPQVSGQGGRPLYATIYMYLTTWLLRNIVWYLTGPNLGHDKEISVATPGLGSGQVTCNVWMPEFPRDARRPPMILILEGGGFVLGHPKDGRINNRLLADKTGAVIVSVAYAKAPRYPYPHALLQAYDVLKWILSPPASLEGIKVDPRRVAIAGNSAGGNLTAALTLLVSFTQGPCATFRDALPRDFRQVAQLMLYPSLEINHPYRNRLARTSSEARRHSLPAWMATLMENSYLPPSVDRDQIFIAPLIASNELLAELRLPHSILMTGGWDSLKEEGQAYAEKLRVSGAAVTFKEYPRAVHGFSHIRPARQKDCQSENYEDCWRAICQALEERFSET
ncbi:alpha/beta-hydrolase [Aspergillus pseudodeflectus]|uniref:Alpha/beta-hydrolase n=1 Tax=Aspergillus pseudodeflectus TaxID=176178 RepID=A0ABR4JVE6_9EURO